jgi:putative aldouronate transport system permease protein
MQESFYSQIGARATVYNEAVKMACCVVATIPILVVYPFLQKYFTKGVLIGAIKG